MQRSTTKAEANGLFRPSSHCFEDNLCRLLWKVHYEELESVCNDARHLVQGGNFDNSDIVRLIENKWNSYLLESTSISHHHRESSVIESILQINYVYTRSNAIFTTCFEDFGDDEFLFDFVQESDIYEKYKPFEESIFCSATKFMIIPIRKEKQNPSKNETALEYIVPDDSIFSAVIPLGMAKDTLLTTDSPRHFSYNYPDIITEHSTVAESLWPKILVRAWKKRDQYAYPSGYSEEAKGATAIFLLLKLSAPLQSCLGLFPATVIAKPTAKRRRVDAGWWAYPISRMLVWSRSYGGP